MMRTICIAIGLCLILLSATAFAQDAARAEIFGGYQFVRANSGVPITGLNSFALNGWNASLTGYFNRYLGITTDFAGTYGTPKVLVPDVGQIGVNTHLYTFMAGPVVRLANPSPFQPFAHVLFGGARVSGAVSGGPITVSDNDTGFAWAAGGGLDYKVLPILGLRLAQVDFLQTRVGGDSQQNFRYSAGVVLRF